LTKLVRTKAELQEVLGQRGAVLVPTMGALHEGHRALIETAKRHADVLEPTAQVVVSIFVNPLQFEDQADFANYPDDLIADTALATEWGADVIWAPAFDDIYGAELQTLGTEAGPLGQIYEGAGRPGHFDGVLQAVAHLFEAVKPFVAIFGEKDFQQLVLVRRLASQFRPPVEIVAVPTQRGADGMALASRLIRLTKPARQLAQAVPRALATGVAAAAQGSDAEGVVAAVLGELDSVTGLHPEYVVVVDEHLSAPTAPGPARILLAATIEGVRIIDNQPIELQVV
jgi:pantoate--beta-alanine ligase